MSVSAGAFLLAGVIGVAFAPDALAGKQTVCTITVNSPDEKDVLRRRLPEDQYEFVELVERGRPDWLASACRAQVRCDVLVISGHFDDGTEFYSDRLGMRESLQVAELERTSCSDSCSGVFSQLKEVYLFGCNTLNANPRASTSPEIQRSLIRTGYSPAEAERLARLLDQRLGESNRDQMRRVFRNVPVIYGFSSKAPLGPIAATHLNRFLDSTPAPTLGSGRTSPKLLSEFAGSSMTVASGLTDAEPQAAYRRDVCQFVDDRLTPAQKLNFVHGLLSRDVANVRMLLERIENLFASLSDSERQAPAFVRALSDITRDDIARWRFLSFAEDADLPQTRARMIKLATLLGWLSPEAQRTELVRMVTDLIGHGSIGSSEVELVCSLNASGGLDRDAMRLHPNPAEAESVGDAAARACLGSIPARARVLKALTSPDEREIQIAQVYFSHRPITDVGELRVVASGITRMTKPDTQVRALDTLAQHRLSDRQSLNELARLYPTAGSVDVQRAIAAVFIRADDSAIAKPDLAHMLAQYRLKPSDHDIIDILIRRLRSP